MTSSAIQQIRSHREAIFTVARQHGIGNIRVFGSVLTGMKKPNDIDMLVSVEFGRSLIDLIAFSQEVEEILGTPVDVVAERGLSPYLRESVLKEAVPI
jgi:uncharacterized protein